MSTSNTTPTPQAAAHTVSIETTLELYPPKSFPGFYEEIAKSDAVRVGISINHDCLYFFIGKRIVCAPMRDIIQALGPKAEEMVAGGAQ